MNYLYVLTIFVYTNKEKCVWYAFSLKEKKNQQKNELSKKKMKQTWIDVSQDGIQAPDFNLQIRKIPAESYVANEPTFVNPTHVKLARGVIGIGIILLDILNSINHFAI